MAPVHPVADDARAVCAAAPPQRQHGVSRSFFSSSDESPAGALLRTARPLCRARRHARDCAPPDSPTASPNRPALPPLPRVRRWIEQVHGN